MDTDTIYNIVIHVEKINVLSTPDMCRYKGDCSTNYNLMTTDFPLRVRDKLDFEFAN